MAAMQRIEYRDAAVLVPRLEPILQERRGRRRLYLGPIGRGGSKLTA